MTVSLVMPSGEDKRVSIHSEAELRQQSVVRILSNPDALAAYPSDWHNISRLILKKS